MADDSYNTVPVQYDPWDTTPPVASTNLSGGLGIPASASAGSGQPWSTGYQPVDRLLGLGGQERYQTWPERMIRSGATLPHDTMTGDVPDMTGLRREDFTDAAPPQGSGLFNPSTAQPNDQMIDRANDMAGTVALGTAPAPAAARGSAGVFLGPMGKRMLELQRGEPLPEHPAAVANMRYGDPAIRDQGMREAQAAGVLKMREAAGLPTQDVFDHSGMFLGADGIPRREVPDLGARLVPALNSNGDHIFNKHGLEFRYEHPAGDLHAAYDLPNITVGMNHPEVGGGGGAFFDPKTRQIVIGANPHTQSGMNVANSVINHEMQHAIQHGEGLTGGGDPRNSPLFNEYYADGDRQLDIRRNLGFERLLDMTGGTSDKAKEVYKALQGEVEARNVQARRAKGYNYLKHPELTEDVPRNQQIIPYNQNSRPSTNYLRSMLSDEE